MAEPILDALCSAANVAGNLLLQMQLDNSRQGVHGDDKAADLRSQQIIVKFLARFARTYDIPLLAEEQDEEELRTLEQQYGVRLLRAGDGSRLPDTYISVDPLDSSVNWKYGRRDWGVSIGLVRDGQPVVGAVYLPRYKQLFTAERGRGAWLNGERVTAPPSGPLGEAMIGLDMCGAVDTEFDRDVNLPLAKGARYFANLPSVAGAAQVAEGLLTAWVSANVRNWDAAGMAPYFTESGGIYEGLYGEAIDWQRVKLPPLIVASSLEAAVAVYPTPQRVQRQISPTVKLNIAMQLPLDVAQRAIALSRKLGEQYDTHFVLDAEHHPHITLDAAEFPRKDVASVLAKMPEILRTIGPVQCLIKRLEAHQGYVGVAIEKSEAIERLHERVVHTLAPLRVVRDPGEASYAMVFTEAQLQNDVAFGYADAMDEYNPHFTLTRFKDEREAEQAAMAAESIPRDISGFVVQSFGVYTMGEHGTCTRQVWAYGP